MKKLKGIITKDNVDTVLAQLHEFCQKYALDLWLFFYGIGTAKKEQRVWISGSLDPETWDPEPEFTLEEQFFGLLGVIESRAKKDYPLMMDALHRAVCGDSDDVVKCAWLGKVRHELKDYKPELLEVVSWFRKNRTEVQEVIQLCVHSPIMDENDDDMILYGAMNYLADRPDIPEETHETLNDYDKGGGLDEVHETYRLSDTQSGQR